MIKLRGVSVKTIEINISDQSFTFLNEVTDNLSAYIDYLIETHRRAAFQEELENDPPYQTKSEDWDCSTGICTYTGSDKITQVKEERS